MRTAVVNLGVILALCVITAQGATTTKKTKDGSVTTTTVVEGSAQEFIEGNIVVKDADGWKACNKKFSGAKAKDCIKHYKERYAAMKGGAKAASTTSSTSTTTTVIQGGSEEIIEGDIVVKAADGWKVKLFTDFLNQFTISFICINCTLGSHCFSNSIFKVSRLKSALFKDFATRSGVTKYNLKFKNEQSCVKKSIQM